MSHKYSTQLFNYMAKLGGFALAALLVLPGLSLAQVTTYTFSQTQGTYTPIATPDETYGTENTDDTNFPGVDLGFSFDYNGQTYTEVGLNANGIVVFGPNSSWGYTAISPNTQTNDGIVFTSAGPAGQSNLLAPFASDMRAGTSDPIRVLRTGTPGSRRFIAQWTDFKRWRTATSFPSDQELINFQVILSEGTNTIEFVYGTFLASPSNPNITRPQFGIRGNDVNDFFGLSGSSMNSVSRASTNADQVTVFPSGLPTPGLTYRFAPIPPAPNDLGLIAILAPRPDQVTCLLSSQETVRLVVRNFGTSPQTAAPIGYRVNGGAPVVRNITFSPALLPGTTDTIEFTGAQAANLNAINNYRFKAWVKLSTEVGLSLLNDSLVNYNINLTGPITPPARPLGTLAETVTAQWREAQGLPPVTGQSDWNTGFPFSSETIAIIMRGRSLTPRRDQKEWLLSPAYNVTPNTVLIFKGAVTVNEFGSSPVPSIGDDTLRVSVSTDCGNTWRTLTRFTQADLISGRINNTLQEYRVPLGVSGPTSVRLGFYATSNNSPNDTTYRLHLDDIELKEVLPNDMGAISVLRPVAGTPGCLLSAQEPVVVVIRNFGTANQTQATVRYTVNGSAPVSNTFTLRRTLIPGASDTVTFTGALGANLSTAGKYRFVAYTVTPGENALSATNDTAKADTVRITNPLSLPSPRITDIGGININRWARGRGLAVPAGTASDWGFGSLPGNNGVVAVRMDSARNRNLQQEWIYSPSYQASPTSFLTFKVAVIAAGNADPAPNGMEDDTLYVRASTDCGSTWRTLIKLSNRDWTARTISNRLAEFNVRASNTASRLQIGFLMFSNATRATVPYRVVLDDIQITNPAALDAGPLVALAPFNDPLGCPPGTVRPRFSFRNYGADNLTSIQAQYSLNGGAPVVETFTLRRPLVTAAADTVTFVTPITLTPGTYRIAFRTLLNGDTTRRNDTMSVTVRYNAPIQGSNYSELFDQDPSAVILPQDWTRGDTRFNDWRLRTVVGNPNNGVIAAKFNNALRTSAMGSPIFSLATDTNLTIATFKWRIVEDSRRFGTILGNNDSLVVDVTSNCGQTWTRLLRVRRGDFAPTLNFRQVSVQLSQGGGGQALVRFRGAITRADFAGCFVEVDSFYVGARPVAVQQLQTNDVALYPNPAHGMVTIQRSANTPATLLLIDGTGRMVLNRRIADFESVIDVSSLPAGIYTAIIRDASGAIRRRFAVE